MTYIEYVNIILQAMNEVPLTPTQFSSARGLHQFAKESINRAYFDIVGEYKWPWMQPADGTSLGQRELSGERTTVPTNKWTVLPVPNPYKDVIDWTTIYYVDSEGSRKTLAPVDWEMYETNKEYYETPGEPKYVVQSADGRSMGLIPFPTDNIGKLYYRIWTRPSRFNLESDSIPMPDIHYQVLVDGALHHMWSFRGDVDQAQLAYQRFEKGLKKMKQRYTNQSSRLRVI